MNASRSITRARLTKYERTRVLAIRVSQLSAGAKPLVPVPPQVKDPMCIAKMELEAGCLGDIVIVRKLPDRTKQEWTVAQLYP